MRKSFKSTERMLHKTMKIRAEQVSPLNQYDVLYADITADWELAVQGVYDFLNMPFTEQAKSQMQAWLNGNKQHKHGAHKYSLSDFGLDAAEVDHRMAFYREHFNIPYEKSNPHQTVAAN